MDLIARLSERHVEVSGRVDEIISLQDYWPSNDRSVHRFLRVIYLKKKKKNKRKKKQ